MSECLISFFLSLKIKFCTKRQSCHVKDLLSTIGPLLPLTAALKIFKADTDYTTHRLTEATKLHIYLHQIQVISMNSKNNPIFLCIILLQIAVFGCSLSVRKGEILHLFY